MFPRIFLAVDNCFASKRWTEPDEWMRIVSDCGVHYVEASADNECDPLYTPPDALRRWNDAVREASQRHGVRVCNLYSGHGSYATLGLAHPDVRVRDHLQRRWLEPMIDQAAALGAGLGFYCHAFSQAVLADAARYRAAVDDLTARLAQLAVYAQARGLTSIGVEQMYSPHQVPWTIRGSADLLRSVYARGKAPFYLTLDTGHQVGQRRFLRPSHGEPEQEKAWLGLGDPAAAAAEREAYIDAHPYLFAEPRDGDLYAWLETLGAYSPILHLQQTDGSASAHRPFTEKYNRQGIVVPAKLFAALAQAYRQPTGDLPPKCEEICFTLEIFSGTAERPAEILRNLGESVAYWRQFIPEDGLPLDQLNF